MIKIQITDDYGHELAEGDVLLSIYPQRIYIGHVRVSPTHKVMLDCQENEYILATVRRPWQVIGHIDNAVLRKHLGEHAFKSDTERDKWLDKLWTKLLPGYKEPKRKVYRTDALNIKPLNSQRRGKRR